MFESPLAGLAIYPDGSKIYEYTGDGLFCLNPFIRTTYKFNDSCSDVARIVAIKKAAEMGRKLSNGITGPVILYVDSQSSPGDGARKPDARCLSP